MPIIKRPMNDVGQWLNNELAKRGVLLSDFAVAVGTTPQNLSYVMRNDYLSEKTMTGWRERFETALKVIDATSI